MPGSRMSPANAAFPVTLSRASVRASDRPMTVNAGGLFNAGFVAPAERRGRRTASVLCTAASTCVPLTSVPYATRVPGAVRSTTKPSRAARRAAGSVSQSAASWTRTSRASAPAALRAGPKYLMLRDPLVPPSHGHSPVSPITMSTLSKGTSSSSASIWASAVVFACPISTLPE